MRVRVTNKALAAKAADAHKTVALKAAGLPENATTVEVVKLFKQTVGEGEKSIRDIMRKLAELAGLLVEGYGLTQEQVAEKVGRSQPWVSGILRWRRDGYKLVAFGPETHKPKLLPANNPAPSETSDVRLGNGQPLDTSKLSPTAQQAIARATGNGVDPEESARAMGRKIAGDEPVASAEPGIPEPPAEPVAEDKPLPVSVMLDNRLATIEGLTPWALWLECSEHLGALMNVPTREGMTKETASLVRRLTNNHHAKKAA